MTSPSSSYSDESEEKLRLFEFMLREDSIPKTPSELSDDFSPEFETSSPESFGSEKQKYSINIDPTILSEKLDVKNRRKQTYKVNSASPNIFPKKKFKTMQLWKEDLKNEYLKSDLLSLPNYRPWIEPKSINPHYIYDELNYIDEGATAQVFVAHHKEKLKLHAIKLIKWHGDLKCLCDIMIEVECLEKFNHKSIVNYFDFYVKYVNDFEIEFWICMEYLEEYTCLTDYIRLNYPLNESEIAYITFNLLTVLKYLHSNNLIYRDVKSDNIMIQFEENKKDLKLIDFGFAAILKKTEKRNSIVGTTYFMAPEVINGLDYSYECDIWSLGITIYEMMKGEPPLTDLKPTQALFWISSKPPPGIPDEYYWSEELKDFLSRCLVRDTEERANVDELLQHPFLKQRTELKPNMLHFVKEYEFSDIFFFDWE
eukprot:gene12573-6393_t